MEAQSKCVGVERLGLITHLNSKIEEEKQIFLENNKKENNGKPEMTRKTSKSVQNLEYNTDKWNIGHPKKIVALKWIELSIVNGNNTLEIFEWRDISQPKKKIGDGDNDKDKGETKETETKDEGGSSSNKGMIELTSAFQSYSELVEAYATIYAANNKRAKVIVKFQDNTELNLTNIVLQNKQNAMEGDEILEEESVVRQLLGNGPEK